jgi:MoaA/NifB/PqqE/SkfB family radical SAM enzyme
MTKCILPWIHLEATATGLAKPCCLYNERIYIDNKVASLSEFSIQEVWNSDYMNNLRKDFLDGKTPTGCQACWEMESVGKRSKRQISNEWFGHHLDKFERPLMNPVYLDLKLGTVCNLKCRSCSSFSSSKWVEDEIKLYKKPFNKNIHSYWIDEDSKVWEEIELLLPDIEYLDFTGGEPLLIKKHFEILKKCIDLGYSKNIKIHYNTNGTVEITKKMFDIWNEFKSVELMFSIDGIENKFEYLRNPGKWNTLVKNFESTLGNKKIYVPVCYSVSIFNVMYMNEFINWFKTYNLNDDKLYFNLIFKPGYLNIQSLKLSQKEKIKKYLEETTTEYEWLNLKVKEVIDFMMKDSLPQKVLEFSRNTTHLDSIRSESFELTFPELAKILKED